MTTISTAQKPDPIPERKQLQTFKALHHRNYRLWWISLIVSAVGTWMQIVAQSLLVLDISHNSAPALGLVSLAQASSFFLFALIGGSVADRIDKRRFLLITQSLSMSLAFLLGILTITGLIQVWMIVVLAFCSGTILSFDQPTRSSLVPILVPREDLMNAISLQAIVFNGSAFLGPTLAGFTIGAFDLLSKQFALSGSHIGYAGNFFLNAVSFLGVLFVLYRLHLPEAAVQESTERRGPLLGSITASLRVVRDDMALPWVLSGYGALLFFGPSTSLILPIFARQVLNLSNVELGILFSASGLGIILGALLIASLGDVKRKGLLMLASFLLWSAALTLFALSHLFWLSVLALLVLGIGQNGVSATTITLMQTRVPSQMRGRIMSLNSLFVMGLRPLGDFPASALIVLIGGPFTVIISCAIVGGYTLFLLLTRPAIRSL